MDIRPLGVDEGEERRRQRRNERTWVQEGIIEAPMNTAFVQRERYQAQGKDDTSKAAMKSKETLQDPHLRKLFYLCCKWNTVVDRKGFTSYSCINCR